jgi:hypothetical protein
LKKTPSTFSLFLTLILLFLISPVAYGDLYWDSTETIKGLPGQVDQSQILKTYITDYASRAEKKGEITILNFEEMTSYEINTVDKTYTKNDLGEMLKLPEMDEAQTAQLKQMLKQMADSTQIVSTDETKEISGYKCRKYDVQMMMAKGEYWVSQDVKGYAELKTFNEKMAKTFENAPMVKLMNMSGILNKLDGFPIMTIMTIMGGTTTTTVNKVEQKPLDKSLFTAPVGYKLVEKREVRPAAPELPTRGLPERRRGTEN